jgi:adenylate cyclase
MFTDMVGFTALGQEDEPAALELLESYRHLLRPIFSKHRGREVKTMGDGFLVEFESALEATLCAIDIQNSIHSSNLERGEKLLTRIGIHVGDVFYDKGDIVGDAVNIASRIESIAKPGGICISGQVYDYVRNKIPYSLSKLETRELKNVRDPVEVYEIVLPWEEPLKARCAWCSKPILGESLRYETAGETMLFDSRECLTTYKKLRSVYGESFR